jgi:1-acyl-sn-glycerol-3-phosphate acyltransferase
MQRKAYGIEEIVVQGIDRLRTALAEGAGVLIVTNHVSYPDAIVLAEVSQRISCPFYYMTAWQVFGLASPLKRAILRRLGCFSVDREGTDLAAFRTAVEILQTKPCPLVIFPEGEMYHNNDRVMPFHDGAAAIALSAARKSDRPIVCVPCALRYESLEDPTRELEHLLDRLEQRFFWRPSGKLPHVERVYHLAEAALALKEIEHMGQTQTGTVPERLEALCAFVLNQLEERYGLDGAEDSVPRRVKKLRQTALERLRELPDDARERELIARDLDEVFLAVQLFSYPRKYLAERPSLDRLADTLDKLEEDILGVPHATVRGRRRATLSVGDPLFIASDKRTQPSAAELTLMLETSVQQLLNRMLESSGPILQTTVQTGETSAGAEGIVV